MNYPIKIATDFDGVWLDSYRNGMVAIKRVASIAGLRVKRSDIKAHFRQEIPEQFRHYFGEHAEELVRLYYSVRKPHPLVPCTLETLEALRDFEMHILTSRRRERFNEVVKESGFPLHYFRSFITREDSGMKPSTEVLKHLVKVLGTDKILYVADSLDEWQMVRSSRERGVDNIDFVATWKTGPNTKREFIFAGLEERYLVRTLAELPQAIEELYNIKISTLH